VQKSFLNFKFGFLLSAVVLVSFLNVKTILAQSYSQGGGGQKITVDKKIRPINDSTFYDNIDPAKKVFVDGEQLEFKITVENSGSETLYNIELKDVLPKYLSLLFYPGVYNKTNNDIVANIDQLDPGQSKDYYIRAYISNVPTSTVAGTRILQINRVNVSNGSVSDSDQAQYYIAANVVPGTGADDLMAKTAAILLVTISAVGLRKLARGY
jgi:uncharacterized repeat protein (TIGR01451 family)